MNDNMGLCVEKSFSSSEIVYLNQILISQQ